MLIKLKNKDTLIFDEFKFKCAIGKNGLKKNKIEGDKSTPKGIFSLGKLYYRSDRVPKPETNLTTKKITKNLGWCDISNNKYYNQEVSSLKNVNKEKFFRKDNKYDYLIIINYNKNKIKNKGSAIFIHLTRDYKATNGCVAVNENDFLILAKLINKKTHIKLN
jgi:L,D-peptidoglycan transpeptidase YkuD (ErfK/YbiS/YcfS/YnhG family)|tara:strand:+ start:79 stop:567 length:489 start_codon:yes stop_codon:yes gene_type:complete